MKVIEIGVFPKYERFAYDTEDDKYSFRCAKSKKSLSVEELEAYIANMLKG